MSNLQDNNFARSFEWLVHSDLKIETESLILAEQDRNSKLNTIMHPFLVVVIRRAAYVALI